MELQVLEQNVIVRAFATQGLDEWPSLDLVRQDSMDAYRSGALAIRDLAPNGSTARSGPQVNSRLQLLIHIDQLVMLLS